MTAVDHAITTPTPPAARSRRSARAFVGVRRAAAARPHVLRKNLKEFIPRTILQPLLLVFVFTYVSRRSARASAAAAPAAATFSSVLVAGVVASAILFQGIQAVALPLVQEFGYTREIEDRVLAPLPVELVGVREDRRRRAAVPDRRAARVPDRRHRAGHRRCTSTSTG